MNKTQIKENAASGEQGAAMVIAILAMLLITVLAFALISTGMVSEDISTNGRQQTEAYYISETGLSHGSQIVGALTGSTAAYTAVLQAGDGVAGSGDELTLLSGNVIVNAGTAFGTGSYRVLVSDDPADADGNPNTDSNRRLRLTAIGTGRDGSSATTEAILASTTLPAILINGNLTINGNPSVTGAGGVIHANGNINVSGNPCVSQYVSSTSTVTVGGSILGAGCGGAGVASPNQPPITVPSYDIQADFKSKADYILGSNGRVTNQAGTVLHNSAVDGNDWNFFGSGKWTWNSGSQKWVHGGSSMQPNKTYYVVGNMELGSDFGSAATPVPATFVAEGSITVGSNPYVQKYLDNKYAFMAGKDLTVNGNPVSGINSSTGIHYAGDQLKLNGNPRINGVVIAANKFDNDSPGCGCNPVQRISGGRMEISGNAQVFYDGGLIDGKPTLISWREVRN